MDVFCKLYTSCFVSLLFAALICRVGDGEHAYDMVGGTIGAVAIVAAFITVVADIWV